MFVWFGLLDCLARGVGLFSYIVVLGLHCFEFRLIWLVMPVLFSLSFDCLFEVGVRCGFVCGIGFILRLVYGGVDFFTAFSC